MKLPIRIPDDHAAGTINKLRAARLARSWTQVELAFHAGITPGDISRFENGMQLPYPKQAERLAKVLGLAPAELLDPANDDDESARTVPLAVDGSLQVRIESAITHELRAVYLPQPQIAIILANLRRTVGALPADHQNSALFVRYVEMVDALVALVGAGPNYTRWRRQAAKLIANWKPKAGARLDGARTLQLVAAREADCNTHRGVA